MDLQEGHPVPVSIPPDLHLVWVNRRRNVDDELRRLCWSVKTPHVSG
jgi:hypothetical protein